jgi:metal-responsive CopG/Arc/MetJ family transcriptional regulator
MLMKAKLSLTLDEGLVAFVDAEPGATRSEKIESMLRRYRDVQRDMRLREELAAFGESADDRSETEAWQRIMKEGMWKESVAATSGPSRSRRSRSRGRR